MRRLVLVAVNHYIEKVESIAISVTDQDRAVEFYARLGFATVSDEAFGDGLRWVEVGVPGDTFKLAFAPPLEDRPPGEHRTGIILHAPKIDALHAELSDAGVDVDPEVTRMGDPVPPLFWLRDPDGNVLQVIG